MAVAVDALRAMGLPPTVEAKFIFDPEEEVGSPHLQATLARHANLLAADLLIFADGPVYPTNEPTVVFGTRGVVTVSITVYGPAEPVHSGHYGNWAPNPAEKLAGLLASMKDASGRVLVNGFYDQVRPLSASEQEALDRVPPVEEELQERLLIARPDGDGASLQELINLPSLNVRGMAAAWVGSDARTIVPATATAEIDLRLVKDIDPERQAELLADHARSLGFHVVTDTPSAATRRAYPLVARITHSTGTRAVRTSMDTALSRRVIEAVRRASGRPPVLLPTLGGTVPLSRYEDLLGLPVYGVPMVNADNNQHSPDENLRLGHLWDGIGLYASLLRFPAAATSP
jgi:acetylornithine deacetylase/succinyl-diaminopimelate desuccinylase-like protein